MIIILNKIKKAPTKGRRLHQRGVGGVYLDSAKASLDINFSPNHYKTKNPQLSLRISVVGVEGFEPPTLCL